MSKQTLIDTDHVAKGSVYGITPTGLAKINSNFDELYSGSISTAGTTFASMQIVGGSTLGTIEGGASTLASLSVAGGSTLGTVQGGASTLASLSVPGASTLGTVQGGASTLASLSVPGASTLGTLQVGASTATSLNVSGTSALAGQLRLNTFPYTFPSSAASTGQVLTCVSTSGTTSVLQWRASPSLQLGISAINALNPPSGSPMVGDASRADASGTDDAPALQAMINASILAGGVSEILIPGRRTYKIGSTVTVPTGVRIRGIGARNNEDSPSPPRLVWGGAADGVMFIVGETGLNNTTSVVFENLSMCGRTDLTNVPATFIQYGTGGGGAQSPDSGVYLQGCWFDTCRSHAIVSNFATNFYICNSRWDNTGIKTGGTGGGGYAIYAVLTGDFCCHLFGHNTYTAETDAGGFMYMNAEAAASGTPYAFIKADALKIEIGGDLAETYAGGASAYDKRGIFRFGVSDDIGNPIVHLCCDALTVNRTTSCASYCVFQITAADGTDADNSDLVQVIVDLGAGLGEGDTDTDADDITRPIGGRIPAARRPPSPLSKSGRWGRFQYGRGLGTGYGLNRVVSWTHSLAYQIDNLITGPVTTVAALESAPRQGARAFVTDASTNLFGTALAAGSTCTVPVYFAGTAWRIG